MVLCRDPAAWRALRRQGHLLYSLAYFEDAEQERMPKMLWELEWPQVRQQIEDWARELASS